MRTDPFALLAGAAACIPIAIASDQLQPRSIFWLDNRFPSRGLDAPVLDWQGNRLVGAEWRIELFGGPAPDSLSPAIALDKGSRLTTGFYAPGYFRGASSQLGVVCTPNDYPWAWLQVRVWNAGLGTTYEEVRAGELGGYGESSVFFARGGFYEGATTPWPPEPLLELQSFTVRQIVPEPSSWALLAVGGLGLWWARWRSSPPFHP